MPIETALLLINLTGGYYFARVCPPSAYYAAREIGHNIYFRSVFYAAFLTFCALIVAMTCYFQWGSHLPSLSARAANSTNIFNLLKLLFANESFRYCVYALALILGVLLSGVVRLIVWAIPPFEKYMTQRALRHDEFEVLVFKSVNEQHPMLVTLSSGKVYVGWAVKAPHPKSARRFLTLLPLLSGFRAPTQQRVEFTTNYWKILDSIENGSDPEICYMRTSDLEVVIPTEQIISAHLFDLAVYDKFQIHNGLEY